MITLAEVYQVQDAIESAVKAVLGDGTSANLFVSQDDLQKDAPFVDIMFEVGERTGHLYPCPDGVWREDSWTGTLTLRVVTARSVAGQPANHMALRGQCVAALLPGQGRFNTDDLPYHELPDLRVSGMPYQIERGDDCDVSEIQFACFCAIRPGAWLIIFQSHTADTVNTTADTTTQTADAA